MNPVYQYVTDRILAELDKGVVPWRKPWLGGLPINWVSRKEYRGINLFLLPPGEYLTFKQALGARGYVRKGETGRMVVFYKLLEAKDRPAEDGKKRVVPLLRYYTVFEVSQCEGIERRRTVKGVDHDPVVACEEILAGFTGRPPLEFGGDGASYSPSADRIRMPAPETFISMAEYYCALFHEIIHATGHPARLNRLSDGQDPDDPYAFEELVAEMGAAMLCGRAGIEAGIIENSAAYIEHWRQKISGDPLLIVRAASSAQKAADFILGIRAGEEEEHAESAA
jgi:antirestriction protein ArdC